jgi:hypothetical protein
LRRPAASGSNSNRYLIGTLRRPWKLTEIDAERAAEISAAEAWLKGTALPAARHGNLAHAYRPVPDCEIDVIATDVTNLSQCTNVHLCHTNLRISLIYVYHLHPYHLDDLILLLVKRI